MIKHITILLMLVCLFSACSKNELIKIEGVEEEVTSSCVSFPETSYVIENEASLIAILSGEEILSDCQGFSVPEIDYEQRTLVGKLIRSNFCSPTFEYEVWANTDSEVYEVHINTDGLNICEQAQSTYHWISFGKLPSSYNVVFYTN